MWLGLAEHFRFKYVHRKKMFRNISISQYVSFQCEKLSFVMFRLFVTSNFLLSNHQKWNCDSHSIVWHISIVLNHANVIKIVHCCDVNCIVSCSFELHVFQKIVNQEMWSIIWSWNFWCFFIFINKTIDWKLI